ncbi:MAG TPA: hypothetical protein VFP06_11955, partial [Acidimicrobiales bacterium]|nr:hypothetical protein [Acidimicrobiales bacterium]
NIHVHLDNSPGTGITATIDIPTTLLTTDTDLADPITPPHGHRHLPTTKTNGAAAVPAAPTAPPDPGPLPVPSEVSRTQSGLVKRAARPGGSTTVGAGEPSGELLDSLRRHTANLQVDPQAGATAPTAPAAQPPARDAPAAQPPAAGPAWSNPPAQPPAAGPTWSNPAAGPTWGDPPAQQPPTAAAEAAGGATTSGLARRVRGAQLPTAEPMRLRRGGSPGAPPARTGGRPASRPSQAARPARPAHPDDRPRSADDVYSFLSSFSAGVRRGLDESSSRPQPGRPPAPGR